MSTPLPPVNILIPGTNTFGWYDASLGVGVQPPVPAVVVDYYGEDYYNEFPPAPFGGSGVPGGVSADGVSSVSSVSFSTAGYGKFIPIVFGGDKITGNVFWASPIRQHEVAGAAGASGLIYQTIDFALGICEGEIDGILKMWIGDKLILSNSMETDVSAVVTPSDSGYVSSVIFDLTDKDSPLRALGVDARQTRITVFNGSEDQVPAGVMANTEGYENSPAYRGLAFILFENFIITQSSIPAMSVEVASNTSSLYPRLAVTLPSPKTRFNVVNSTNLLVDLSYDRFYVRAIDNVGDGTIPNSHGIVVYDYNAMTFVDEFDVKTTIDPDGSEVNAYHLFPQSGKVLDHRTDSNAGYVHVINPFSATLESSLGPAGGLGGHDAVDGFAALGYGTICFVAKSPYGIFEDILCGIGSVNKSIGFASVNADGQLKMWSSMDAVLTKTNFKSTFLRGVDTNTNETFIDGGVVRGAHVFIFQYANTETSEFMVTRVTVENETSSLLEDPVLTEVGEIALEQFAGEGFTHSVHDVFVNQSDGTLILLVDVASGDRGSYIAKYNPYTGGMEWVTEVAQFNGTRTQAYNAFLNGQKYAWMDGTVVYSIDLKDGTLSTVIADTSVEDLPGLSGDAQFYNGDENSLLYVSTDDDQYLVKIYLDRLQRNNVNLKDIVTNLVQRVGLLETDVIASDLNALTLSGYSITAKRTLRAIFAELAQVFLFDVIESNGRITYKTRGDASIGTVDHHYLSDKSADGWLETRASIDIAKLRKINLTYRDVNREYKDNVQTVQLPPFQGINTVFDNDTALDVRVPIVLTADEAKRLAEILLFAKITYGTVYSGVLPARFLRYDPGDVITLELNDDGSSTVDARLRTVKITPDNRLEFEAVEDDATIYTDTIDLFSATGTYTDATFQAIDRRIDPLVLNMPYRTEDEMLAYEGTRLLYVAFLNVHPTAVINARPRVILNYTTAYYVEGPFSFPTWGYVTQPLDATASPYSTDDTSVMRIKLVNDTGAVLASCTQDDILNSDQVNLAWVGGELIQFTTVTDLGNDVYELTIFHRAKLGTDYAVNGHDKGERFILLSDADGLVDTTGVKRVLIPTAEPQASVAKVVMGSTNPRQVLTTQTFIGLNASPWTVASLTGAYDGSGHAVFTWVPRNRYNGDWADDGDESVVIDEATETYTVYIYTDPATFSVVTPATYLRTADKTVPNYTYPATDQTTDGFDRTTTDLYITVVQEGTASGDGGIATTFVLPQV